MIWPDGWCSIILGLLSSVDDLDFLFFNPLTWTCSYKDFLRAPIKRALCANANISEVLTATWKSAQVNKEPQVCALLSPHEANTQHWLMGRAREPLAQAALLPPLILQIPKEREAAKVYFFIRQLQPLIEYFLCARPCVKHLTHVNLALISSLWSRYFYPYFQMRKLRFKESHQPDQDHTDSAS